MIAFAKDIRVTDFSHPDEKDNEKLKEYMEYQRKLNHDLIVYHSLDHAKSYLQRNMDEAGGDADKLAKYLESAFPFSRAFADADTLLLMLRKLVNAQNASTNWYRLNDFYFAVAYDCIERFVKIYNRLLDEDPAKAEGYNLSRGVAVDFDDWVQLYFHSLDFAIGRGLAYTHYLFRRRNRMIEQAMNAEERGGKSKKEALEKIREEFEIDPSAVKIAGGERIAQKDLELFYTSTETPLYDHLYNPDPAQGMMDDESVATHQYFIASQLKGLNEQEAENLFRDLEHLIRK